MLSSRTIPKQSFGLFGLSYYSCSRCCPSTNPLRSIYKNSFSPFYTNRKFSVNFAHLSSFSQLSSRSLNRPFFPLRFYSNNENQRNKDNEDVEKQKEELEEKVDQQKEERDDEVDDEKNKEEQREKNRMERDEKLTSMAEKRIKRESDRLFHAANGDKLRRYTMIFIAGILLLGGWILRRMEKKREVDLQYFRQNYLLTGRVSRIVVEDRKTVYFYGPDIKEHEFFYIDNISLLERELEDIQFALGIPLVDLIPVQYIYTTTYTRDAFLNSLGVLCLFHFYGITQMFFFRLSQFSWRLNRKFRIPRRIGILKKESPPEDDPFNQVVGNKWKEEEKKKPKSPNKVITFKDVAGQKEAKREITEFVEFLKNPAHAKRLGARLPRGALLTGPPGTGKTLLAKATAGEAGVPFHTASGSDFIERYVGMGALRVRQLFAKAKQQTPCIVWIDEIDSVARTRSGTNFRNEEREQTLNQLLVELDGFTTNDDVIVFAGTNRADLLDPAILRPGRFDRKVTLVLPDLEGRKEIALIYLKHLKLYEPIETVAEHIAAHSPGMSGAEIANVCNEAAIIAARRNKKFVSTDEFNEALDRVQAGIEQRGKRLNDHERRVVAYHEAGHAIVGWFMKHVDPLIKISIVPRGLSALGFAQYQPSDRPLYTTAQIRDQMCMTLGGRASEKFFFGHLSTGAADDLSKVSSMAYSQVVHYGMSEKVGLVSYDLERSSMDLPYSQKTAKLIDEEVRDIVLEQSERADKIVREKQREIRLLAEEVLHREVLTREDLISLLGPRPFEDKVTYGQLSSLKDNQTPPPPAPEDLLGNDPSPEQKSTN